VARNPFRSEQDAFRFLLLTIGYFVLIVIGAMINRWLGLAVFIVLTVGALYFAFFRDRPEPPPRMAPRTPSGEGELRILVIANETVGGRALQDTIREKSAGVQENVLVVTPALNSPLRHLASDEDQARVAAQERLDASLAKLRDAGISARGEVGDAEPLQAMEDALRTFGADEIIISTHPEGRSHWLEKGVVANARQRFAVPITHVVVDLEAEQEEVR
jgi:hypothetical protein